MHSRKTFKNRQNSIAARIPPGRAGNDRVNMLYFWVCFCFFFFDAGAMRAPPYIPKWHRHELPEAADMALPGPNAGFEEGQEDGTTRAPKWTPNQARRDLKIAPHRLQNGAFRGPKRALKGARGGQDGMFPTRRDRGQGCSPLFGHSKAVLGPLGGPKLGS